MTRYHVLEGHRKLTIGPAAVMADDEKQKEIVQKEDDVGDITFFPPLYQQRYCLAVEFLEKRGVTSVVDFGCAECKLMPLVRRIPCIEDVVGVDIDRELLRTRHYILKPLLGDYLSPREKPLRIRLFEGSVGKYDSRLDHIQAVTMVEVIEHLTPDVLEEFPGALFGRLQPEYVLITTPNAEFNVLFANFTGMRHDDHKFEWTREEFQAWCSGVCSRYPYDVEYGGVGKPPDDRQDVGHCSQYAVFTRQGEKTPPPPCTETTPDTPYDVVLEMDFPYRERLGEDASILLEATYHMRQVVVQRRYPEYPDDDDYQDYDTEDESDGHWIALDDILRYHRVQSLCTDAAKLRAILREAGFVISQDGTQVFIKDEEDDDGDMWGIGNEVGDEERQEEGPDEGSPRACSSVSEENWSDGEDERCQQATKVIPYSVMWEDADEDAKHGHRLVGSTAAPPPQGPSVLDTDPDMVYVPAVLHAAIQPRHDRNADIIPGQFDDDDFNGQLSVPPTDVCPAHTSSKGDMTFGHKDKVKLEIQAEDGQFDDIDSDDDTQININTELDITTQLIQNGQSTDNSMCAELHSLTLTGS